MPLYQAVRKADEWSFALRNSYGTIRHGWRIVPRLIAMVLSVSAVNIILTAGKTARGGGPAKGVSMKKLGFVLVLASVLAGGVFGQTWYKSYAPGIEGTKFFVNAGIGYGVLPYKIALPPISASAEYALAKLPISVGAYFGITTYEEETVYTYKGTMTGFGAKASYHFNFLKNLDTYASVTLGWLIWSEEYTIPAYGYGSYTVPAQDYETDLSTFLYGFNVGARYFFTKNIGAYVELGYSAVSVASVGLALKF
jgi:hypothetical protein